MEHPDSAWLRMGALRVLKAFAGVPARRSFHRFWRPWQAWSLSSARPGRRHALEEIRPRG